MNPELKRIRLKTDVYGYKAWGAWNSKPFKLLSCLESLSGKTANPTELNSIRRIHNIIADPYMHERDNMCFI